MSSRLPAHVAVIAALLVLAVAGTGPPAAGEPAGSERRPLWWDLLADAAQAAGSRAYRGEVLWIDWSAGAPQVARVDVIGTEQDLTVRTAERYTVRLGGAGGGLVDHEQGWFLRLPAVDPAAGGRDLDRLADKYRVELAGTDALHDRACTRLDIRRRVDDRLRERLWVDEATGLVLRREHYDGDERLLRMAAYLSLDLTPQLGRGPRSTAPAHADRDRSGGLERRDQGVVPVGPRALQALREAGWLVPPELPGGYEPTGVWAVSSQDSQPLQIAYGDGLYSVSLFQQHGRLDGESLPPGAARADGFDWPVYHWPGALPQRLVWEASGTTFSLVGDLPADELRAMAAALPHPRRQALLERLGRGFGRLWSWVAP